jgi:hypothetical protein
VVAAAIDDQRARTYRRRRVHSLALERRDKRLQDRSARAGAIHRFKHLKHHGYEFPPDAVRAWALATKWRPADADELAAYAEGVAAGTRYHCDPDPFGRRAIDRWRAAGSSE